MGFNRNMYGHIICVCCTNEGKVTKNVVQAYTHKRRSIAIISDNGTEFKNAVLNDACEQLDKEIIFKPVTSPRQHEN